MRVLIVDDDTALRTAMQLVFEDAGHEVSQAESIRAARSSIHASRPDAVLVDAGLSEGGVNFWRELQMDADHEGRALLFTGNTLALGALRSHPSVIAKPFDYGELLERIAAMGPRSEGGLRSVGGQ